MKAKRKPDTRERAIRSAWAMARARQLEGIMTEREDVRRLVVDAWVRGFGRARRGKKTK